MNILNRSHLPQVNDEAVALVETAPGQIHFCRPDGSPALDMQETLDVHVIGHYVLKA